MRELWLGTQKVRTVSQGVAPAYVSAGGFLVAARADGSVEARPFDAATGDTTGPARRIAEHVGLRSTGFPFAEYTASASGTLVTVRGAQQLVVTLNALTSGVGR